MNHLIYLHSIGFTQKDLHKIFIDNSDYKGFFEKLNFGSFKNLGIKDERVFEIMSKYKLTDYDKIDKTIINLGIRTINHKEKDYPELLRNIPNPPFLLYIRGRLKKDMRNISIVGSRKSTQYSKIVLEKIIPDLLEGGFSIVSGGALGVDSLAHNITLNNGGCTYSIIGTGIDEDYPQSNRGMYKRIIENSGAVISIFRLGTQPEAYNFPIRNEIIAGMSLGTLVTEAGEKSGTLITANLALELNRDVFVIPGDISKQSSLGSNRLLRDGLGKIVLGSQDILEEYGIDLQGEKLINDSNNDSIKSREGNTLTISFPDDEIMNEIINLLRRDSVDASIIANKLGIDSEIISSKLSMMEIEGFIELESNGKYKLN